MQVQVFPEVNGRQTYEKSILGPPQKKTLEFTRKLKKNKRPHIHRCAECGRRDHLAHYERWIGPPRSYRRYVKVDGKSVQKTFTDPGTVKERVILCPSCALEWEEYLA